MVAPGLRDCLEDTKEEQICLVWLRNTWMGYEIKIPLFFPTNLNRSCYKLKRDLQLNRRTHTSTHTHTHTHTHTYKVQVQFDSQLQHVSLLCVFEQEKHNTIQSLTIFVLRWVGCRQSIWTTTLATNCPSPRSMKACNS